MRALLALGIFAGLAGSAAALNYRAIDYDDGRCQPNCSSIIVATGTISAREVENLRWFMDQNSRSKRFAKVLFIHSPGGNAYGGLTLGSFLRTNGVTVIVAQATSNAFSRTAGVAQGICGSACVFVLAGGAKRIVPPGSKVAVHSARSIQGEIHDRIAGTVETMKVDKDGLTNAFATYYRNMGISPDLARLAESVPHQQVRVLSQAELSRFKLAQSKF